MHGKNRKFVLLSFDVEEFDLPLNYHRQIGPNEQLEIGERGLANLMHMLSRHEDVKCTFFTTALFAENYMDRIQDISYRHEIASHTCTNSVSQPDDLLHSRQILEMIILKKVYGLRMPQMQKVETKELIKAGYQYDASINPTWIPGRYNNLNKPRSAFLDDGFIRIPASVSALFRIPLFWLSFKNLPYIWYKRLARSALKRDGYLSLYFHPWEFTNLMHYRIPGYLKKQSDGELLEKLDRFITEFKEHADFISMNEYCQMMGHWRNR